MTNRYVNNNHLVMMMMSIGQLYLSDERVLSVKHIPYDPWVP